VINPDQIRARKRQRIAAPNIFMIQITDLNILHNHILARETQPFAFNHALTPHPENSLIRTDLDRRLGRFIIRHRLCCCRAAAILQNALAFCPRAPVRARGARDGAFGGRVVEGLVEDDDARCSVGEPGGEFGDVFGVLGRCGAAACDAGCETFGGADDADGGDGVG